MSECVRSSVVSTCLPEFVAVSSTAALFQVLEGVLKIYRGNPATPGIQPVLTFSLPKGPSFKSY